MADYEEVTLSSRDPGIDISAWYVPADGGQGGPAVVMVHGHSSCKPALDTDDRRVGAWTHDMR